MTYYIVPSLLAADPSNLQTEVHEVMNAGADFIHLDVMDNHYVPNLSFGPNLCLALKKHFPTVAIDVHLMASPVDSLIETFADSGANRISIHPEASLHVDRSLALIREKGCEAGLVLNPASSPECLHWCLDRLDFVLVMMVNPGFGGQHFIPSTILKITWIKKHFPTIPIMVDGGVTLENIKRLARAGATQFVAGSSIFSRKDYAQTLASMRQELVSL